MTISLNPTESYIDSSLNEQSFSSISLSLQLSLNDVSFCITNNSQDNYLAIVCYTFTEKTSVSGLADFLVQLFQHQDLLKKDFAQVFVSYKNNTATLIPTELFEENQLTTYLKFTSEDISDAINFSDFIKEIDAYNVYSIPQSIEKLIKMNFVNAKFIHNSTAFIQGVFNNKYVVGNADKVFVNINNNELEVIIVKGSKFYLYNCFQFKMKEDFLYYLLFVMKQFNCDPTSTEIIVMGKIAEQSPVHSLLLKYIAEVNFAKNTTESNLITLLNETPQHYYFTLLNLNKCV
jgi:hypothetical protein